MERTLSHFRPVIDKVQNCVVAWKCRVTLSDGESALDEFEFRTATVKPLNSWTQGEVVNFLNDRLDYCRSLKDVRVTSETDSQLARTIRLYAKHTAKITRLYQLVEQRKRYSEVSGFSMDSLKE